MNVSIAAVAIYLWTLYRPARARRLVERLSRIEPTPRLTYCCAVAIVVLFGAQACLLVFQVKHESIASWAWTQQLPIPVYDGRWGRLAYHRISSYVGLAIAIVETALLAYIALAAERRVSNIRRLLASVAASLAIIALATPAMSTTDPYEYAASAMIGWASYAPPHGIFDTTTYAAIFTHVPLRGVLYGPLWLALDTAELHFIPTILEKLLVLRVVNVALLVLFFALLGRLRVSRAARAACLANPALWYYCVVSPHADIEGIVIIVAAALALAASRPRVAMVLVGLAGCIKLPFVIAGVTLFAIVESARRRVAYCAGAIALTLAGTFLFGGRNYVHGVGTYLANSNLSRENTTGHWAVFGILAVAATAVLLVYRRGLPGAAWLFGQLAPLGAPWYLLWGMPFAFRTGILTLFAISLPLTTLASEHAFNIAPFPEIAIVVALCAFIVDEMRSRRLAHAAIIPATHIL